MPDLKTSRRQKHQQLVDHLLDQHSRRDEVNLPQALALRCQAATGHSRVTPEVLIDLACWLTVDRDALFLLGTLTNDLTADQLSLYAEGLEE